MDFVNLVLTCSPKERPCRLETSKPAVSLLPGPPLFVRTAMGALELLISYMHVVMNVYMVRFQVRYQ
jgi:hypothetical protein